MTSGPQLVVQILLWGAFATMAMTALLYGAQSFGWSRLNLPFLVGTLFTGERAVANVIGFALYALGGWLMAFVYYLAFALVGRASLFAGLVMGAVHGLVLLAVVLPLAPYAHPRMASPYQGPTAMKRLEPPGFLGMHYGYRTPLVALAAQCLYGALLGWGWSGLVS